MRPEVRRGDQGSGRTVAFLVAYDGSGFHGLQVQPRDRTVQGDLEAALAQVLGGSVRIRFAGRTDTGVHAIRQMVAFEVERPIPLPALRDLVNSRVAPGIRLLTGWEAAPGFHPRFQALRRRYRYVLAVGPAAPDPFRASFVTFPEVALDWGLAALAAARLEGTHDFRALCTQPASEGRPIRSLDRVRVTAGDTYVYVDLEARAFLRGMVRHVVGALWRIAAGERAGEYLDELLVLGAEGKKDATLRPAPPQGLYLTGVDYPQDLPGPEPVPARSRPESVPWLPDHDEFA